MKAVRVAFLVIMLASPPSAAVAAPGGLSLGEPPSLSGTVVSEDFRLRPGETVRAKGRLRIVVQNTADIQGALVGDAGHPIEIVARGPLVVLGRITGGTGAPGSRGGDVVLKSLTGEVRIEPGDVVASGAGGDATKKSAVSSVAAAGGGDGGDVTIAGSPAVVRGTIRLGDGGRGGDANSLQARAGDGGDSGNFVYKGDVAAIRDRIDGGRGGAGGSGRAAASNPAQSPATSDTCTASPAVSSARSGNPAPPAKQPADGSAGTSSAASGGNGAAGAAGRNGPGGASGNFTPLGAGNGANGGDACPGGTGGDGGRAQAIGGAGGDSAFGTGGAGGDATAVGGTGGSGGRGGAGGAGGRGGTAVLALGGNGGNGGNGGPGGLGGNGGDACAEGGAGGIGAAGNGPAGTATATPGAAGAPGAAGPAGVAGPGGTSALNATNGAPGQPGAAGSAGQPGTAGAVTPAPCLAAIQVSTDPYTGGSGQHQTEVEPDSFAYGSTMVSAFQVARIHNGGAMNVGWATSKDDGATWSRGYLPSITKLAGGPWDRASDPVVAYSARDNVWFVQTLGIEATSGVAGRVVLVSRSADGGTTWGPPVTVAGGPTKSLDKNWMACDNTPASPYYGNCYSTWDDHGAGNRMEMSTSTNGGLAWGPVLRPADNAGGLGGIPLVQPDGDVVVTYSTGWSQVRAFSSTNGGASWGPSMLVSAASYRAPSGLRAPPLPTAEVAADGTMYVAWHDCRFRSGCSANDIVLSKSIDGTTWTAPVRIPIDPTDSGIDHFIPGLAVNPATSGSGTHLFVAYYKYPVASCTSTACLLQVGFASSADAGATWTSSTLEPAFPLAWISDTTQGRMVGDYISASFLGSGRVLPIWSHAYAPQGTDFDQGMESILGGLSIPPTSGTPAEAGGMVSAGTGSPAPADPPTQK
ncbi:MAG TPA: sialidase family protein [Actinomycetota bacterium]|nr:sialidase family protein [Actinomycetota bacterium]